MFEELSGKAVLITGASTGIGAAVAAGFGRCGARIGVHYNRNKDAAERVAEEVEAAGGEAILLRGNVTATGDLGRIMDETARAFGRLDVLINNAGDVLYRVPFEQLSEQQVDEIMALNARSVVTACRLAIPHLKRQGGGSIINTTSIAARQVGGPGTSIYAASKAFVQSVTRCLARELAQDNIRVNAVAPGVIETPLHERRTSPEQMETMRRAVPMGRIGRPEECVGAFLFLATDGLSSFVTGATIDVNGGQFLG